MRRRGPSTARTRQGGRFLATAKRGHRWYDRYPPLATLLEQLKDLRRTDILRVIRGLRDIIVVESPGLIDQTVLDYPLATPEKRRWYDFDPLCWLTINAMQRCDETTIVKCVAYLREALAEQPGDRSR
jgi:hypothetical protein